MGFKGWFPCSIVCMWGGGGADKPLQKKGHVTKRHTGSRTRTVSLEQLKQMEPGHEIQCAEGKMNSILFFKSNAYTGLVVLRRWCVFLWLYLQLHFHYKIFTLLHKSVQLTPAILRSSSENVWRFLLLVNRAAGSCKSTSDSVQKELPSDLCQGFQVTT
jgi:hypothetical protein